MRKAWLILGAAAVICVLGVTAAFALSTGGTGDRDGSAKIDLQDPATVDPRVSLDLSDVERAIERVADVRRTAASQSRLAGAVTVVEPGESVRWELENPAFVEAVILRDAAAARAAAPQVAKAGGAGTTVIQSANVVTLVPDALVTGDLRGVGEELRRMREATPEQAAEGV